MIHIRRAERHQVAAIIELLADDVLGQAREVVGDAPAPAYLAAFDAIDADPNQLLAAAHDGDTVIGTLQVTFIPGLGRKGALRGQIEAVRIARNRRGEGLGEVMMEWAIAECRNRGCALVQLTTDKRRPDAHRFYERLGFEPTHIAYKKAL